MARRHNAHAHLSHVPNHDVRPRHAIPGGPPLHSLEPLETPPDRPKSPGLHCPVCGQWRQTRGLPGAGIVQCVECHTAFRASVRGDGTGAQGEALACPSLPGFVVQEQLGRGATGVVYRARHVATGRAVAIKQMLPSRSGQSDRALRFEREVELLRRQALKPHENVVRFLGCWQDPATDSYLSVLEYIDGPSLAELLQRAPLQVPAALEMLEQVARGLQSLHEAGLLHRDLKPRNILRAASGHWKITDFGLVREVSASDPLRQLTAPDTVLGTPDYLAPELLQRRGEASVRSDLFSLGAVLHEALTGAPPRGVTEGLDDLRQGLPDGLADLAAWMLHPAPEGRCPDTQRLLLALEDLRRGERPVLVPNRRAMSPQFCANPRHRSTSARVAAVRPPADDRLAVTAEPGRWSRLLALLALRPLTAGVRRQTRRSKDEIDGTAERWARGRMHRGFA